MPVEAQPVTDGLETNKPGSQDLCPGTRVLFTYVFVTVLPVWVRVWVCRKCYMYAILSENATLSIYFWCEARKNHDFHAHACTRSGTQARARSFLHSFSPRLM